MRSAGLVAGKRSFLDAASPLFAEIVSADRATGTRHSSVYYDFAMRILFTTVSIDDYTSDVELSTIERYRTTLLATMDQSGVRNAATPASTAGTDSGGNRAAPRASRRLRRRDRSRK